MDITPRLSEDTQRITAYGAGIVKINGESFETPLIVQPSKVSEWQKAGIDETSITALIEQLEPLEVLLIGTGESGEFLPPALRNQLRQATGAGIEVMDSGAACRTYNVLMAEGRKVAAVIIPV